LNEAIFFYRKIGWYRERPFVPIYSYMYIETRGFFLWPNPICTSDSEGQMVGRSNATNSQFMRPEGANKLVNETANPGILLTFASSW